MITVEESGLREITQQMSRISDLNSTSSSLLARSDVWPEALCDADRQLSPAILTSLAADRNDCGTVGRQHQGDINSATDIVSHYWPLSVCRTTSVVVVRPFHA